MAGGKTFGPVGVAVAFILLSAINISSADNLRRSAAKTEVEADSTRGSASLIDGNERLRLGSQYLERSGDDYSAIGKNRPIVEKNVLTSHVDIDPRRRKRFVFLIPLVPIFGGLSMGTVAAGAAAVGVGTAAAVAISQNGPVQMPSYDFRSGSTHSGSSSYAQSKKTEPKTEPTSESRKGQLPPGHSYHPTPKELPAFPDFEKTSSKSGRPRWKNPKTKEILEYDRQHGELEKYDKRGKHQGAFDKDTGKQLKPKEEDRSIEV